MSRFYRIKGLVPGLDGLIVESSDNLGPVQCDYDDVIEISRMYNVNQIIGDREVSVALPDDAMWLHAEYLDEVDDPRGRQYSSSPPFGTAIDSSSWVIGGVNVARTMYQRALGITLSELMTTGGKTLFSQYFLKKATFPKVDKLLAEASPSDADELVFKLQELKEEEGHGET